MCKRHTFAPETRLASEGAYEGQTMRLVSHERKCGMHRLDAHIWGFPWWALWLIWPLIELAKLVTPLVLNTLAAMTGSLGELGAQFVALLLIVAGITLLRWSYSAEKSD
ncbi:MAG TPA: hypothetical protein VFO07_16175 [Roseiflexaceae bacterium]|nr:hypothetical protein [Roseiflexaceae bacterium]